MSADLLAANGISHEFVGVTGGNFSKDGMDVRSVGHIHDKLQPSSQPARIGVKQRSKVITQ